MREVKCPKCGRVFVCKHDESCFCMKYHLSEEAKKDIRSKWNECLCEDCLRLFAETIVPKSESCS
jgi:hypothetical protein